MTQGPHPPSPLVAALGLAACSQKAQNEARERRRTRWPPTPTRRWRKAVNDVDAAADKAFGAAETRRMRQRVGNATPTDANGQDRRRR